MTHVSWVVSVRQHALGSHAQGGTRRWAGRVRNGLQWVWCGIEEAYAFGVA